MPREIEANALTNVEVEFISLVPNAASRLPFRLTKDDRDLDFAELQEAFMKQDTRASEPESEAEPGDADGAPDAKTDVDAGSENTVMARLEEGLTALAASLAALTRVITDFETRLSAAEVQVTKTERRLAGTVHGTPVGDPEAPVALAKAVGEPPLMDTGMGFYA